MYSSGKDKEMEILIDSDVTMLATNSFNNILQQIQNSSLNYHLQVTPFSALVSLKKSFIKDKTGKPILPPHLNNAARMNMQERSSDDNKKLVQLQELAQLRKQCADLSLELSKAYKTIDSLRMTNQNQIDIISDLERETKLAKESAQTLS